MLEERLEKTIPERFRDRNGHVQSTNYFFLFDEARAGLLEKIGLSEQHFRDHGEPLFARDQQCSYKRQLHPGENVVLVARIRDAPRRGILAIEYDILKPGNAVAARGKGLYAFVDKETGKHRQIPGYFMDAIRKYVETDG